MHGIPDFNIYKFDMWQSEGTGWSLFVHGYCRDSAGHNCSEGDGDCTVSSCFVCSTCTAVAVTVCVCSTCTAVAVTVCM